jgi:asparagine synthase (glutamine-hydrolysing)
MAFSLESRTPLCDNEMLDFALSIPLSVKLADYELKHIPRTAMRGKLPDFIYKLPKRGFPTPLRHWFKKELKGYIRNFIFDNITFVDMFDREEVRKIILRYQNSKIPNPFDEITAHKIWIILNLIIYFKNQRQRYKTKTLL